MLIFLREDVGESRVDEEDPWGAGRKKETRVRKQDRKEGGRRAGEGSL